MEGNTLYRNQFILGPTVGTIFTDWTHLRISEGIQLAAHPNLTTYHAARNGKSLTLVGFILDPDDPAADNRSIAEKILDALVDVGSFPGLVSGYGGRWILIVCDGRETVLINDAAGLRQVFFTDTAGVGKVWCASQPRILAEIIGLQMDPEAVDFIDSYDFRRNKEYRWPAYRSPYREIRHMLPNHLLDLSNGKCRRYWPDGPLPKLTLTEGLEKVTVRFEGLMESAAKRFDLALSVTAGLDSRMVLAASRKFFRSVSMMTVRQIGMPEDHADVSVPDEILKKLGLRHDVIRSSLLVDREYREMFKRSIPLAHDIYLPDAYAICRFYGQRKVAVTGGASEIARSEFREKLNKPVGTPLLPEDLAKLQSMGTNRFALEAFEEWLAGLGQTYDLDPLDLFEWEQGHGNWLAMCQLEFDMAWRDIFTPFNCRALLCDMLSVGVRHRQSPRYELFEGLIAGLWPELLGVPINPHKHEHTSVPPLRAMLSKYTPRRVKNLLKRIV